MRNGNLFGSRVRAETLEALASTSKPLTAYRVAKVIERQPIQVLTILKALPPNVVAHTDEGWVLTSEPLRRFLRDELARREKERRVEKDSLLARLGLRQRPENRRR